MRRWLLPTLLATLALPSVVAMLKTTHAILSGQTTGDWITTATDLCQGTTTIAIALILVRLGNRPPTTPLWLVNHHILAHCRRSPDQP